MIAYGYDKNGYYTNEKQCQLDPLETKAQGKNVWLLPADSTFEKPLDPKEGYKVKFVDGHWTYEAIPVPPPPPEPTEDEKKERVRSVRASYFETYVDWYQSKPLLWEELSESEIGYRAEYREYLKDYTKQDSWWEQDPLTFEAWMIIYHPVEG